MTEPGVVFVIDDDESVRDAVTNLLEAVNLRAHAFASTGVLSQGTSEHELLSRSRPATSGHDRPAVSAIVAEGWDRYSDRVYHRVWRRAHRNACG
jgi:hypothetical protein